MQSNYEEPLAGTKARRHYLRFSPSICSIRSLPAFSNSASAWPRSPLAVSFLGLGSSSAHRPAKRQQIDRSRFIRSILQLLGLHNATIAIRGPSLAQGKLDSSQLEISVPRGRDF